MRMELLTNLFDVIPAFERFAHSLVGDEHFHTAAGDSAAGIGALMIAAASIGFFHTLFGPDHYLPFVMMSWSRKWSMVKTMLITFICGIGHVFSSVVLGLLGVALGLALNRLELFESNRGTVAAWLLIAFGLAYFIWGVRNAIRNKPHTHGHFHEDDHEHDQTPNHDHDHEHAHEHVHTAEHMHVHNQHAKTNITPWVLFVIFVFGPCEPLIPMLMYPASQNSWAGLLMVTAVFSVVTIGTMLIIVALGVKGFSFIPMKKMQRYSHAIAGATILLCGVAIVFIGL